MRQEPEVSAAIQAHWKRPALRFWQMLPGPQELEQPALGARQQARLALPERLRQRRSRLED